MKESTRKHWTRWPMAIWEGLLFGWFVFMTYIATQNVIQVAEFMWHPRTDDRLPRLTVWMHTIFPEETWSLLTAIAAFSLGFGLISLTSKEAPSSRLFRWAVIAALTMLVGVALPVVERYTNLSGGPDGKAWDEVLFVSLALATLLYGAIRLRRHRQQQP